MIDSIEKFLSEQFNDNGYYVKEFSSNLYFGKDKDNNYICARKNSSKEVPFSIKTDCIYLYQNYNFELNMENEVNVDKFDLILLKSNFSNNLRTFINLCLNFYAEDSNENIIELTEDLIEMFKSSKNHSEEVEQGLWGELFFINYMKDKYNIDVLQYWHKDDYSKYDFSIVDNKKVEVKTTVKENRVHKFSHSQVYTKNQVIIASILMRSDNIGCNLEDLYNKVQEGFGGNYKAVAAIQKEIFKLDKEKFKNYDYDYSMENIRFYSNENIPKFNMDEPDGVFHTKYDIDLEKSDPIVEDLIIDNLKVGSY